jgi:hypothetical protein
VKKLTLLFFLASAVIFAQPDIGISGAVEWDTQRIKAEISLDLVSAGIRLPSGRTQAESHLSAGYINLIKPNLLRLQIDSSSTIADLVDRGELSLSEIEAIALQSSQIAPALSPDLRNISASHTIALVNISSVLKRHSRPTPVTRTLNPVSAAQYTGIIIIAAEELPVHGMRSSTLAVPCLFPKIWDSDMNLIYEYRMLEARDVKMARYFPLQNIFQNNPSGLSAELQEVVGERPLRIFARGVFGITPTDPIIERSDAMLIISSDENRRLLTQGRVAIILNESVLRYEF